MKNSELIFHTDWIQLVKDAMKSNISKEDFKMFLKDKKEKNENK